MRGRHLWGPASRSDHWFVHTGAVSAPAVAAPADATRVSATSLLGTANIAAVGWSELHSVEVEGQGLQAVLELGLNPRQSPPVVDRLNLHQKKKKHGILSGPGVHDVLMRWEDSDMHLCAVHCCRVIKIRG